MSMLSREAPFEGTSVSGQSAGRNMTDRGGEVMAMVARHDDIFTADVIALAERFPSLHLETEELAYQPSIAFRSLTSLPVAW